MRVDEHITPLLTAAALFAPQGGAALTLSDCDRALPPLGYSSEIAHRDIGGGLVTHRVENRVNGDENRSVVLTHCASGRQISAASACEQASSGFCAHGRRAMDAPDPVAARLDEIVATPDRYSLEGVREALAQVALATRDTMLNRETCGCRAAYPGRRNGKTRFKMEPWN